MGIRVLAAAYAETPAGLVDHYHDCHQIIYIAAGEVRVTVGGEVCHAGAGSVVLISRFEHHAIEVISRDYRRYTLELLSGTADGGIRDADNHYLLSSVLVNRAEGFRHVVQLGALADRMQALLARMTEEWAEKAPMHGEMLDALLREVLVLVYRAAPELYTADRSRSTDIVQEIQFRFERDYHEPFSLSELADEYHISISHLSHLFKKITGYAPMEHLKACRISAAKRCLVSSAMTVKEIVYQCGFADESNFCRVFKKDTGLTPTQFRRRYGTDA